MLIHLGKYTPSLLGISFYAFFSALLLAMLLGPFFIKKLQFYRVGQMVRELGPKTHFSKAGTPTMGGLLFLIPFFISAIIWSNLSNHFVWLFLLNMLSFGLIGVVDDWRKLLLQNSKGLAAKWKYLLQSFAALFIALLLFKWQIHSFQTTLFIPFVKSITFSLGFSQILLSYFVIVGSSNAVNLTDGLDGLAIVPSLLALFSLGVFIYCMGDKMLAQATHLQYFPEVAHLLVPVAALIGAGFGFLWFNAYPASVFMGDMGALSLGAGIGYIATVAKQELMLIILGGVFVVETISVMVQVLYYKRTRKRVFKMAPVHHHFELKGVAEPKLVIRFWIVSIILTLIALFSLVA